MAGARQRTPIFRELAGSHGELPMVIFCFLWAVTVPSTVTVSVFTFLGWGSSYLPCAEILSTECASQLVGELPYIQESCATLVQAE